MPVTFVFEELDEKTRDYLTVVRDTEGAGSPGVFATTSDSLGGCGCIAGPVIIALTLMFTLTDWINIIYDDPVRVAFLQTGGVLIGGWLFMAYFRGKGGSKSAGNWVYVDPLFLYEAFREQVTVTAVDDVQEASFTHNYNNGAYQNSVVNISLGSGHRSVTFANEGRAEQMVVFLNYLAWARGPEGGDRAEYDPVTLGGLAKYVARNDHEPLDANNSINVNMIESDFTEIPEEPTREGRAAPSFMPYIVMLGVGVLFFLVMAYIVNPPLRDDAIYDVVMKEPYVEPRFLRAYLADPRNKIHRERVTTRLSQFYQTSINQAAEKTTDRTLGKGMSEVLRSLSTADQPLVTLRVTETKTPAGKSDSKGTRENGLRTQFADGINTVLAALPGGAPITLPAGVIAKETMPPIGHQLIAFIEPPEDAKAVHFDVAYAFEEQGAGDYQIVVNVTIRSDIEKDPVGSTQFRLPGTFPAAQLDTTAMTSLKDELVRRVIGTAQGGGGFPGGVIPPPKLPGLNP